MLRLLAALLVFTLPSICSGGMSRSMNTSNVMVTVDPIWPVDLRRALTFAVSLSTTTFPEASRGQQTATFFRDSEATYKNASNQLVTVGKNMARFAPSPGGLIIESQIHNSAKYSEQLDNALWIPNNATVTANQANEPVASPAGIAEKITEDGSDGFHDVYQEYEGTANGVETISVFAKVGSGRDFLNLMWWDYDGKTVEAIFNIDTCLPLSRSEAGTITVRRVVTEQYADDWCRCSMTIHTSTNTTRAIDVGIAKDDLLGVYQGDGSSYIYATYAQVERDAEDVTSYIKSEAAASTRYSDTVQWDAEGTLPLTAPGTAVIHATPLTASAYSNPYLFATTDLAGNHGVLMYASGAGHHYIAHAVVKTTSDQADITSSAGDLVQNTETELALAWAFNDVELYVDGVSAGTDGAALMPNSHYQIQVDSSGAIWGWRLAELAFFASRLTAYDLARLPAGF